MKKTMMTVAILGSGAGFSTQFDLLKTRLESEGFPVDLVVVNNTPSTFHLPQLRLSLGSNIDGENVGHATVTDFAQLIRLGSDLGQLLELNRFDDAFEFYLAQHYYGNQGQDQDQDQEQGNDLGMDSHVEASAEAAAKANAEAEAKAVAEANAEMGGEKINESLNADLTKSDQADDSKAAPKNTKRK